MCIRAFHWHKAFFASAIDPVPKLVPRTSYYDPKVELYVECSNMRLCVYW